ncbi:DUF1214 domain-containing protein [Cellulosimicrobium arenosum]|uniref:Lytic murein transglycosylase n=1 Tax=Cellulosimicrobium arenosum TaxID=2708133 RepID=A0A927IZK0_9MICO|nr:DUF1214 domain-containing protein [Cellulosimicrobium arenosum]MBD8078397.1 hypothetical protein [Cellulosimicrobium arenosum]
MPAPVKVTFDSFPQAETAGYFRKQLQKAPVNTYFHNRVPVNVENQVIIRSNVDLIYSYAVVDVSEEATFHVARSEEYQIDQIIDENHYTVGVVYPGETLTLRRSDLSSGTHVYILGRTATTGGVERAHELQDARRITAATANPYVGVDYDQESLETVRAEIESRAAEADFSKGFGTPQTTEPFHHVMASELGWGGLPPQHAQYYQGRTTASGHDAWTFPVPSLDDDHNGYFSVIKYDEKGWLDVERPCLSGPELARNDDGTITVWFGDERVTGKPNVIETTEGQEYFFAIRLYRPKDVDQTRAYVAALVDNPAAPAQP